MNTNENILASSIVGKPRSVLRACNFVVFVALMKLTHAKMKLISDKKVFSVNQLIKSE